MPDNKQIEISLILSAYDKASRIINDVATKGEKRLMAFSHKTNHLAKEAFENGRHFAEMGVVATELFLKPAEAAEMTEVAIKRLNNVFKQMGDTTGRAGEEAADYAKKLQNKIGVDKADIMLVEAKLAAFKKVSSESARITGIFQRTTDAAEDMAAMGFGDAATNAVKLGRALQSPMSGLNQLARSGIVFTKAEKQKIVALEQSGHLLQAQKIILSSIEHRTKGAAAAIVTHSQLTKVAFSETMESLGRNFLPILDSVLKRIDGIMAKFNKWIEQNPKLAKNIGMIVVAVAALSFGISALSFVFGGLMKAMSFASGAGGIFLKLMKAVTYQNAAAGIQAKLAAAGTIAQNIATKAATITMGAFRVVMIAVNAVLAINPFILIAMAVIAVATLIYMNWDKIKAFFVNTWAKIKGVFGAAWDWIKKKLEFTPLGQIIKNWGKIKDFFKDQWEGTKKNFQMFVDFLKGIPNMLYQGGKNMIKSLWEGIKAMASKPIDAVKNIVKKIRDFLPFSPAKEGPLRDIHRIRLIETISENIKPAPMVNAMRRTAAATMIATQAFAQPLIAKPLSPVTGAGGGAGIHIHFNPQVTIQGGGAPDEATMAMFNEVFAKQKKELKKMLEEIQRNNQRTSYSGE